MRILLKLVIDCDADAAWRAVHSPRAVAELYGPLMDLSPLAPEGLPTTWEPGGDVPVQLATGRHRASGPAVDPRQRAHHAGLDGPVRIFRDSGIPLTGPLASLTSGTTRWRSRPLPATRRRPSGATGSTIGGPTAFAVWPMLWATWQWRAARIRAMAPTWAHDPELNREAEPSPDARPEQAQRSDAAAEAFAAASVRHSASASTGATPGRETRRHDRGDQGQHGRGHDDDRDDGPERHRAASTKVPARPDVGSTGTDPSSDCAPAQPYTTPSTSPVSGRRDRDVRRPRAAPCGAPDRWTARARAAARARAGAARRRS